MYKIAVKCAFIEIYNSCFSQASYQMKKYTYKYINYPELNSSNSTSQVSWYYYFYLFSLLLACFEDKLP